MHFWILTYWRSLFQDISEHFTHIVLFLMLASDKPECNIRVINIEIWGLWVNSPDSSPGYPQQCPRPPGSSQLDTVCLKAFQLDTIHSDNVLGSLQQQRYAKKWSIIYPSSIYVLTFKRNLQKLNKYKGKGGMAEMMMAWE